ncbi:hypothetical protein ACFL20_00290 [Spirochaetota bacterium]
MENKEAAINAILSAARFDMNKGMNKKDILKSLSRLIDGDMFNEVVKRF